MVAQQESVIFLGRHLGADSKLICRIIFKEPKMRTCAWLIIFRIDRVRQIPQRAAYVAKGKSTLRACGVIDTDGTGIVKVGNGRACIGGGYVVFPGPSSDDVV